MDQEGTSCCPLQDACRALSRRWGIVLLAGLGGVLVAAAVDVARPRVYEARAVVRVDVNASLAWLGGSMAAGAWAMTPEERLGELDRQAESLVRLMGERILDKDQAFEQYTTTHYTNALARAAREDDLLMRLMVKVGEEICLSWPTAFDDMNVLREQAIRVERTKPESDVTFAFRASDGRVAVIAVNALVDLLVERSNEERARTREALLTDAKRLRESSLKALDELREQTDADPVAIESARSDYRDALSLERRLTASGYWMSRPLLSITARDTEARLVSPRAIRDGIGAGLAAMLAAVLLIGVLGDPARDRRA